MKLNRAKQYHKKMCGRGRERLVRHFCVRKNWWKGTSALYMYLQVQFEQR